MKKKIFVFILLFALQALPALAVDVANPSTGLFVDPPGANDFGTLLTYVLGLLIQLIGAVASVFIVIGAYFYMTSAGNEKRTEQGKNIMFNAVIGFVAALLSYVILTVVQNAVRGNIGTQ